MVDEPMSVGEALPAEMARVRDKVMPAYLEIGAPGDIARMLMRNDLDVAANAMAQGDVIAMIRALESLRGWEL